MVAQRSKWHALYSGDLKSGLVCISNGIKVVGLQTVRNSNGIWNLEAPPFEIQTNGRHFFKNHLKSVQKCPDFEWSSFWMVGSTAVPLTKDQTFENPTVLLNHEASSTDPGLNTTRQMEMWPLKYCIVRYLNCDCIRVLITWVLVFKWSCIQKASKMVSESS